MSDYSRIEEATTGSSDHVAGQLGVAFHIGGSCLRAALIVIGCLVLSVASADDEASSLELVPADPESGFNYPYFLQIPATDPASTWVLIVESNNSGVNDELQFHIDAARTHAVGSGIGPVVARELGMPLLIPVFPRSESDWWVYTHALDRESMLLRDEPRERLDLQLLRMVDDARARLMRDGSSVREKFVLVGFSASGTYANRFAFLHPGRLMAVVSGAVNAFPMLPVEELSGRELDYPLGIADFESVVGKKFEKNTWLALPQMIFMGAVDDNDALLFDDGYSKEERATVFKVLAEPMRLRWGRAQMVYLELDPNVTFVTYGQVGHWTDGRIHRDIVNFVGTEAQKIDGATISGRNGKSRVWLAAD